MKPWSPYEAKNAFVGVSETSDPDPDPEPVPDPDPEPDPIAVCSMARTVAARWTTVALAAPRPAGTVTYCATARLLSAGSSVYVEPTGVSNLAS